jgi:ubiquinone/menaquinone biosynthesis C-methylase UbiE
MKNLRYNLQELRALFDKGANITTELKRRANTNESSIEAIRIAYDFQSGVSIQGYLKNSTYSQRLTDLFVTTIARYFPHTRSILDVGCGELTNTACLYAKLRGFDGFLAMDLSMSRLLMGRKFVQEHYPMLAALSLFSGSMDDLPFESNSIDLIVSSHAVEPNRGKEYEMISELTRVARFGLVLQEPDYQRASENQKRRMDELGYVDGIEAAVRQCGCVLDIVPLPIWVNELNKTSFFVVRKSQPGEERCRSFVDPISKGVLIRDGEFFFSPDRGVLYPIVKGIPNFDVSSSIICTKFQAFND